MSLHSAQTANHRLENWVYADAAARLAAVGFTAADVGKIAYESDTDRYYRLTDEAPITWLEVGGSLHKVGAGWALDSGGNARGSGAVDLQTTRDADTQVASGSNSSIVAGVKNTTSGQNALASGVYCIASGTNSSAFGAYANASLYAEQAVSSGSFGIAGDSQRRSLQLLKAVATHTDTTWYTLFSGTSGDIIFPTDALWTMRVTISGTTQGAAQSWSYLIDAVVANPGGTPVILTHTVTPLYESDAAYDAQVSVTSGATDYVKVQIRRNGGSNYAIRWTATVWITQVIFPT